MGLTADDLMGLIGVGASVWESDQKTKLAESNLITLANEAQATRDFTAVTEKNKQDYALKKEFLVDRREENEIAIANLVKEIGQWNINASEWSTLDDEQLEKTPDGKTILEGLGLEYGEDFRFREKFSNDSEVQLEYTQNLIGLQDEIISDLNAKKNQILGLQEDWLKVGTEAGVKKIKDLSDIKSYMFENKEKFGIPLDMLEEDMDWAGSTNQLAKAFMKQKFTDEGKGFWSVPSPMDLTAAGINPKTLEPVIEETSYDLRTKTDALKEDIKSAIAIDNDTGIDEGLAGKRYSEYFDKFNVDKLLGLLEGKNIYSPDNQQAIKDHKNIIDDIILGMFEQSIKNLTEGRMDLASAEELKALKELGGFDLDKDGIPMNQNLLLKPGYVKQLRDRYIGNEPQPIIKIDEKTNQQYEMQVPKTKIPYGTYGVGGYGLLNKEYYDDKIFHGQKPTGLDSRFLWGDDQPQYGDTSHDRVFFRLLDLNSALDELTLD